MPRPSKLPARYDLLVEPEVHEARTYLPGHIRQRVRRAIADLSITPRPADSRDLDVSGVDVPPGIELRRLRMDPWRVIYAVNDEDGWVWVLAIHRRPPYDDQDLAELTGRLR
jgi:mRNA interferase RelE/StbE